MENTKEKTNTMKASTKVKNKFAVDINAGDYVRVTDVVRVMEEYFREYGGVVGEIDAIREDFSGVGEFVKIVSRNVEAYDSRVGFTFDGVEGTYWFEFFTMLNAKQGVVDMSELADLIKDVNGSDQVVSSLTICELLEMYK